MQDHPEKQAAFKQKITHEAREFVWVFLYLALFLFVLSTYRMLLLNEFHVKYFTYGAALVTAAIVAAVTLWRPRPPLHVAKASQPPARERLEAGVPQRGQEARATAGETPAARHPRFQTAKAKLVPRQRKPPASALTARGRPSEPLTVKLYTDDPEVVIYWVLD